MKPGPKPKGKIKLSWSSDFAYAIGLLTADGCLLNDGRHVDFTSKDRDLVESFCRCLNIEAKISFKYSGAGKQYNRVQFSDVLFREFLVSIGLTPRKSKIITKVDLPDQFFADFLRGYFDGDGTSYSYYDPNYPNSYRFYISFMSASPAYLYWLRAKICTFVGISGHFSRAKAKNHLQLRFSKSEAVRLCRFMYYEENITCLKRKHLKIVRSIGIINGRRGGEIGKHASFRS